MATELKITKRMLKKKVRITPYAIICGIVLLAYSFVLFYPLYFGLLNSMKSMFQFSKDPVGLPDFEMFNLPDYRYQMQDGTYLKSIFANYIIVLEKLDYTITTSYYTGLFTKVEATGGFNSIQLQIPGYSLILLFLWNTIWTTLASALLPTFWAAVLGYVCAKYKYKFAGFIYGIVIFRISCPIIGGGSSMLAMQRAFGFYDDMFGYIFHHSNGLSMFFLILFAYFQGLPDSYMEAAEIDGASQLRILFTIALPLAGTVVSASYVVSIVQGWNDYSTPLMYLPSFPTIAYGLFEFKRKKGQYAYGPIAVASSMYLAIPAFIFFVAFRKKLMGNLSVGGIKG